MGDEPFNGFTQVPNAVCRAPIPLEARGMIVELASHSDGFSVSVSEMAQRIGCTRGRVQSALNAALSSRYLARKEYRTQRGHAYYEYWVRTDRPFTDEELAEIHVKVYLPDSAVSPSETSDDTDTTDTPIDAAESQPAGNTVPFNAATERQQCAHPGCTTAALIDYPLCGTHYLQERKADNENTAAKV